MRKLAALWHKKEGTELSPPLLILGENCCDCFLCFPFTFSVPLSGNHLFNFQDEKTKKIKNKKAPGSLQSEAMS